MAANSRLPSSVSSFVAMLWFVIRLFSDSYFLFKKKGVLLICNKASFVMLLRLT